MTLCLHLKIIRTSVSQLLIVTAYVLLLNLLNETSMAVTFGILFPLFLLLILLLVSLHVVLPVLLPLFGLVHHLLPLALHFFCRELPTSDRHNNITVNVVVNRQTLPYILLSGQKCCRAGIRH